MKDEEAIDWREGFSTTSIGQGKQIQGRVMENVGGKKIYRVFSLEEEENECVRENLVVMCEKVLFMEVKVCKQKNMEGNCV
jgi:hypothetical protein